MDDHVSETSGNGHRLLTFCNEVGLFLENTTKFQKAQATWRSATGFTKRIEYIACGRFLRDRSLSCGVRRGSSQLFTSDHYLLEWHWQFLLCCALCCFVLAKWWR